MRVVKIFIIVSMAIGLGACQSGVAERSFTADVLQGLSENGMAYIRQARQNGDFQRIMDEIAGGNGLLIDNAYLMRPSLDSQEELSLQQALSIALKARPDKVLALMPAHYAYDQLCDVPASINNDHRQQYIDDTIKTLSTASTRFKARQQKQCLTRFQNLNQSAST